MIGIIAAILKTIGIILLVLLAIVLIVLCLVLFVPVRYDVEASYFDKKLSFIARVTRLLKMVEAKAELKKQGIALKLRVLVFTILNTDKEEKADKEKKRWTPQEKAEGDIGKDAYGDSHGKEESYGREDSACKDENHGEEGNTGQDASGQDASGFEKAENISDAKGDAEETISDGKADGEGSISDGKADAEESISDGKVNAEESIIEIDTGSSAENYQGDIGTDVIEPDEIWQDGIEIKIGTPDENRQDDLAIEDGKPEEADINDEEPPGIEPESGETDEGQQEKTGIDIERDDSSGDTGGVRGIIRKIGDVAGFFRDPKNDALVQRVIGTIRTVLLQIRPRELEIEAIVGMDDPSTTAEIIAIAYMLYPLYNGCIRVEGDFAEERLEGRIHAAGRIYLAVLVFAALKLYMNKDFRKLLHKIL